MANRGLTIEHMLKLGRVSRSGFYRFDDGEPDPDRDMDLRDSIQRIAVEWPSYGRPRITAEFVVTTDSNHLRRVYPNLARNMILTATDQLWRADVTYIRLRDEFVFLAVILDAFSRRVIGWALDRTMEDELTLTALRMALSRRVVEAGLVHHSDRGTQYASGDYTDLLKTNGITISMSRKGNPGDNAACESFMKTLKYEEVHRNEYRDLTEARASIREFLEKIYNRKRLHSALGYLPPAEFEAQHNKDAASRQLSL
jgi:transposase InsO family protein